MSTLKELSELLRDQTKWPDGFTWDYATTDHCAIGLMYVTHMINITPHHVTEDDLEMDYPSFDHIFFGRGPRGSYEEVTSDEVADRIDSYLMTVE